jgi:hypothetical protein
MNKIDKNVFEVEDLIQHEKSHVHINCVHDFWPGMLTAKEILAESTGAGEFLIESVLDHCEADDGELLFKLKLVSYPEFEEGDEHAWFAWCNCHYSPAVRQYMKDHKIKHHTLGACIHPSLPSPQHHPHVVALLPP